VIIQKDSNDRSLALRDKPQLGVGTQNISDADRGLSRRAKLLSLTLFLIKLIALCRDPTRGGDVDLLNPAEMRNFTINPKTG